jgi:hypothetical protein
MAKAAANDSRNSSRNSRDRRRDFCAETSHRLEKWNLPQMWEEDGAD